MDVATSPLAEKKLYCAPMEGITGYHFRAAHAHHFGGVDKYYMPFISPSRDHVWTKRELQELTPEHNQGFVAIPQLLTKRAEDFIWAAQELAAMGYKEVNLNLGCPSGTVVAKGKGSGFLAFPDFLDRFLDKIFSALALKISVKTRLGKTSPDEFPLLMEIYNRYPISELAIHPRIQTDFYKNTVRLSAFHEAIKISRSPVVYNGDLATAEDCGQMAARFPGISALMLGRGLIADPTLAAKVKGGGSAGKETLRGFVDELYERYCVAFHSDRNAMMRMKEVWLYLSCLFADSAKYAKEIKKAADPRAYESLVAGMFHHLSLLDAPIPNWLSATPQTHPNFL